MRKFWTEQENSLLRQYYPDNLTEDILHFFPGRSLSAVVGHAGVLGIKKSDVFFKSPTSGRISAANDIGLETRFYKNCAGWNKGKKQTDYMTAEKIELTKATRFQKGQDPHNTVPIGHERLSRDGYLEVKVRHNKGNGKNGNFVAKHRLVWEKNFGPIPDNYNVEFRDDDKLNIDPSNLILRSKKENLLQNVFRDVAVVKRFLGIKDPEMIEKMIKEHPELVELKRVTVKLNQIINKKDAKQTKSID